MTPKKIREFLSTKIGSAPFLPNSGIILQNIDNTILSNDEQKNLLFRDDKAMFRESVKKSRINYGMGLKSPYSLFSLSIGLKYALSDIDLENETKSIKDWRSKNAQLSSIPQKAASIKKASQKLHVDLFVEAKDRILSQLSTSDAADVIVYNRDRKAGSVVNDVSKPKVKKWLKTIEDKNFDDMSNVTQIGMYLRQSDGLLNSAGTPTIKSMIDIAFSDKELMNRFTKFGIDNFNDMSDAGKSAFAKILVGPSIHDMEKYNILKQPEIIKVAVMNNC